MRTIVIVTLVTLGLLLAACAKPQAMAKEPAGAMPAAEPVAVSDAKTSIDSVDALSKDVESAELDTVDSDLTVIDSLS